MMRVKILNRLWNLRFALNMTNRGDCDPPEKPGKEIRISSRLRGEARLGVLIYELVHAAGWHIDEKVAEQFAGDTARVLWRLGYRSQEFRGE
ncbi:MAG: hypothetical protein ACC628_02815 [Pirellulaceae bacterium]